MVFHTRVSKIQGERVRSIIHQIRKRVMMKKINIPRRNTTTHLRSPTEHPLNMITTERKIWIYNIRCINQINTRYIDKSGSKQALLFYIKSKKKVKRNIME